MKFPMALGALVAACVCAQPAHALAADPSHPPDVREAPAAVQLGKSLPVRKGTLADQSATRDQRRAKGDATAQAVGEKPAVGTVKTWLGLDDNESTYYLKEFTLQAVGEHIEVWVANDLTFPAGDCRNDSVTVTREQAEYLAGEFDTRMYPKESAAFSVPPERGGANPLLTSADVGAELPPGYWGGEGDDIVTLVDNVRDANYVDTNWAGNTTYIAGFFSSQLNELFDRNVMTIDAFDWLHRTGATPPDDPSADPCASRPARPYLYESTFAHEYQHLLESYEDPDEVNWVNEGLSDWAQTLVGYVDPSKPITDQDFDSHVQCFLGHLGIQTPANPNPRAGGPENSLTLWEDQGDDEVLCDYGAAYTMMEVLAGRYGTEFMSALHREEGTGLAGLAKVLRERGIAATPQSILDDWLATAALDGVLDRGASLIGRNASQLRTPTLDATVNWDTPEAYAEPGAPPNGADFVRLRDRRGRYLSAPQLLQLQFDGAETLPPNPVEWTVDTADGAPAPSLHSGSGDDLDRTIARKVTVPAGAPTLTFDAKWEIEEGWDFAFVQVSTDGGKTYTSLANASTTTEHDPKADPRIAGQLPGLTGSSGGWRTETFDLSAYAGQEIVLAFRYATDGAEAEPGIHIDDVAVGGTVLSDASSLDGWQSASQLNPAPVDGWTVQLVGYTSRTLARQLGARGANPLRDVAFVRTLKLDAQHRTTLRWLDIQRLLAIRGLKADVVSVLVSQNDPDENADRQARYTLKVNGVTQPGG